MNLFITFDFTIPRLKRALFLGTRWGQEGAPLVPAPGDPCYSELHLRPARCSARRLRRTVRHRCRRCRRAAEPCAAGR